MVEIEASEQGHRIDEEVKGRGREIRSAFAGPIAPVRVPLRYQIGLFLVLPFMVALPAIYLAIIGLVGAAVYQHMTLHASLIMERGFVSKLLYGVPIAIGAALVFFMIKPLFARRAQQPQQRALAPEEEPLLFEFVHLICKAVGAPRPKEIQVDCQVNASASFRRGARSLLSSDLTLTIGLPLIRALSLSELAGVLGHELGHFSQGVAMRLAYVIRAINGWFSRVVYERDAWDDRLVELTLTDVRVAVVIHVMRFFIWLTRKLLWLLMVAGHAASCFLMRQMELDADRHEARLVGSHVFEQTSLRIQRLGLAEYFVRSELQLGWKQNQLADDYPELVVARLAQLPPEALAELDGLAAEQRTGFFDEHPCNKDRVESAYRELADGVFHLTHPASALIRDFRALSEHTSRSFYEQLFGCAIKPEELVETEALLRLQSTVAGFLSSFRRYFRHEPSPHCLLWIGPPRAASNTEEARQRIAAARAAMLSHDATLGEVFANLDDAHHKHLTLRRVEALSVAGFALQPGIGGVDDPSVAGLARGFARESLRFETHRGELSALGAWASERVQVALALLDDDDFRARLSDGDRLRTRSAELMKMLSQGLYSCNAEVLTLAEATAIAETVAIASAEGSPDAGRRNVLHHYAERCHQQLERIRGCVAGLDNPLAQGKETDVAGYLFGAWDGLPGEDGSRLTSLRVAERYALLYLRAHGEIAEIAETIEEALGFDRFPEPPKEGPASPQP